MSCKEVQELLLTTPDLRAAVNDPDVFAHISTCTECYARLTAERKFQEAFQAIAERTPPHELAGKILTIPGRVSRSEGVMEPESAMSPEMGMDTDAELSPVLAMETETDTETATETATETELHRPKPKIIERIIALCGPLWWKPAVVAICAGFLLAIGLRFVSSSRKAPAVRARQEMAKMPETSEDKFRIPEESVAGNAQEEFDQLSPIQEGSATDIEDFESVPASGEPSETGIDQVDQSVEGGTAAPQPSAEPGATHEFAVAAAPSSRGVSGAQRELRTPPRMPKGLATRDADPAAPLADTGAAATTSDVGPEEQATANQVDDDNALHIPNQESGAGIPPQQVAMASSRQANKPGAAPESKPTADAAPSGAAHTQAVVSHETEIRSQTGIRTDSKVVSVNKPEKNSAKDSATTMVAAAQSTVKKARKTVLSTQQPAPDSSTTTKPASKLPRRDAVAQAHSQAETQAKIQAQSQGRSQTQTAKADAAKSRQESASTVKMAQARPKKTQSAQLTPPAQVAQAVTGKKTATKIQAGKREIVLAKADIGGDNLPKPQKAVVAGKPTGAPSVPGATSPTSTMDSPGNQVFLRMADEPDTALQSRSGDLYCAPLSMEDPVEKRLTQRSSPQHGAASRQVVPAVAPTEFERHPAASTIERLISDRNIPVCEGLLDISEWVIDKHITVKERIALAPPPEKAWYVTRRGDGWAVYLCRHNSFDFW